jgi:hypothetical protein
VSAPTDRILSWVAGRGSRPKLPHDAEYEPVRGWRAWRVVDGKDGPTLVSWWCSTLWPTRRELEARCFVHGRWPAAHHICGIHAFVTREDALAYAHTYPRRSMPFMRRSLGIAIGRVSGWGRVVRHTHGWRSQCAYPFDLYLLAGNRPLARSLADRYAVETVVQPPT